MSEKARPFLFKTGTTTIKAPRLKFANGTLTFVAGEAVYTAPSGGGGGGTWAASGITGTANRIAGFDGSNAATYYTGASVVGLAATNAGDLLYGDGAGGASRLPIGANDRLLIVASGYPAWASPSDVRTALSLVVGTNVQAWDAGLDSLTAADASAGLPYVSAANTWASATYSGMLSIVSGAWKVVGLRESGGQDLTMGAVADGAILRRSGTSVVGAAIGSVLQAWAAILDAIAALSSTGFIARTGSGTVAARTLTAGTGVTITNGDGVSGNPTIAATGGTNTDLDPTLGYMVDVQPAGATVSSRDVTLTVRSASAAGNTATLRRTRFTGSSVVADWYFAPYVRLDMSFIFKVRLFTGASIAATTRYKVGIGSSGFTTTDVETATSYILIRASTGLGDTTWKVVTYNGTTATTTDTTVAFAAATEYLFTLTTSPTSITVTINGVDTVVTATLPAASTDLAQCQCGIFGSTAAREWFFVGARLLVTYP